MSALTYNKRLHFLLLALFSICIIASPLNRSAAASPLYSESIDAPAIVGYPNSIASIGDSITRGFNTGTVPFTDAPANSWSTGTNNAVYTHYLRVLENNPLINAQVNNDAVTGAVMDDFVGQAQSAVGQGAGYITVLLGANDACADTEAEMTSVANYRAQFVAGMNTLSAGLPDARIFVLSVPDIYNLWFILKDNASARATWNLLGICQSMLANPQSTAPADVERRNRVRQRVVDYNTQLADVCATFIHCKFDNNTVFNTPFVAADVSTRDYFHPTIAGQAKIADRTYPAGFDFRDGVAPATVAMFGQPQKSHNGGITVVLTAQDNIGVAGIEYKINNGPYVRYVSNFTVPSGTTLTYRAVDVNGTIENARTVALGLKSNSDK